jgi:putative DNA primase/helicase
VLPEQVIGAGDVILAQSVSHAYQQQGSLEQWQSAIASMAVGNTRLIFAISMALTPPLLSPCGWESGGFHLRHQSSTGKTTTLRVAASAFGGPPNIRSWRATSNGLEGVAAAHCDSLLVLDELSQVSPREAGQIAYMLANGSGKTRANREGGARAIAQWRLLFLSSGEIALAEKVAEDGRGRATAGQQIRIVDVPSNLEHGLFENLHGHDSGQAFADHMTAVSSQYYGTAAPVFIEKLLTEPDKGKSLADSICLKFLESIPDAHGQVARVAHRFAIVAAAGELGIRHNILPWPAYTAINGVHACFKSWFEAWGGPGAIELRSGIDQVRAFFELHGESRFEPFYGSADRPVHNRAGFRKTAEDACEWFVLPKVWREEVCRGFDMVNLNRELIRLKILIPGDGNKASSPHKIAALGSVVKRLYHITDAVIEGDTD